MTERLSGVVADDRLDRHPIGVGGNRGRHQLRRPRSPRPRRAGRRRRRRERRRPIPSRQPPRPRRCARGASARARPDGRLDRPPLFELARGPRRNVGRAELARGDRLQATRRRRGRGSPWPGTSPSSGTAASTRPHSSATSMASNTPSPAPPCSSPIRRPGQPASTAVGQRSGSASGFSSASRAASTVLWRDRAPRAASRRNSCSSERAKFMTPAPPSPWPGARRTGSPCRAAAPAAARGLARRSVLRRI